MNKFQFDSPSGYGIAVMSYVQLFNMSVYGNSYDQRVIKSKRNVTQNN